MYNSWTRLVTIPCGCISFQCAIREPRRYFRELKTDTSQTQSDGLRPGKKTAGEGEDECRLMRLRMNRCGLLSDCNRIPVFHSGFPDIPRKISAYLRTESSSDANTRILKGFYKMLYINDLHLRGISSLCKKHHFGLRNGLYWRPKSTISHPEIGFFRLRNGHYQKAKRTFPDYDTGYMKSPYARKRPLIWLI